ncbi:MAG: NUDIX domain-containing protein [Lachnospiraceae bacterium]|nr:NUDIX domain-containing protein [Lachnospiraceae bacterium]
MYTITTLCYLERDGEYLMLHRVRKKQDINQGKWIGLGGHLEAGESPEDCVVREVFEECGLTLTSWRLRGIVTFLPEGGDGEYMFLYTADGFEGTLAECDEGELAWVKKERVYELPLWQGDRLFLDLLRTREEFFSLKLWYRGDALVEAALDGRKLELFDLLDENGCPTGGIKERELVHQEGDLHRTAHVWIARRSRETGGWEILLQKRSAVKDAFPGCYDISSAGHITAGKDYLESAMRELREELGLAVKAEELREVGMHRGYVETEFYGRPFKNNELARVYVLVRDLDIALLTLQESEVESVRWQPLEECLARVRERDEHYCIWEDELVMLREALHAFAEPAIASARKF